MDLVLEELALFTLEWDEGYAAGSPGPAACGLPRWRGGQEWHLPHWLCLQGMFEPYLKSFYIRSTDPTQIKILKVTWKHPAEAIAGAFGASWSPSLWGNCSPCPGDRRTARTLCPGTMSPSLPLSCSWRSSPTWPTRPTSPPSCGSSRYATAMLMSPVCHPGMALGAKTPPRRGWRRVPPGVGCGHANPRGGSKQCRHMITEWGWHVGDTSCVPMPVQTYIRSMDKDFVAATIQAIGRCATNIGKVRDTCLNGLVQLLSNRDGECVWWGQNGDSVALRAGPC